MFIDLQKSFANFVKKLCIKNIHATDNVIESRLEAFMANWLIPLKKNPELRPKGVTIVSNSRGNSNARSKEICSASHRWLQVCAGQDAIAEAAIHAMYDLYQQDEAYPWSMQKTLSVNRKAMLHNISIICSPICYLVPARLFVTGNKEVKCKEGTTLWDTIAMGAYALGVTPLIHFLHECILVNK